MQINPPVCPTHSVPITLVCLTSACQMSQLCTQCLASHPKDHSQRQVSLSEFLQSVYNSVYDMNSTDIDTLKFNDKIMREINQAKLKYEERQKELIKTLMEKLEEEKGRIVQKAMCETERRDRSIVGYFGKMGQKGLLGLRVLFSSKQGLRSLYAAYGRYCEIEEVPCHVSKVKLPEYMEMEEQFQEKIRKSIHGSLTSNIMNYIKLKVSKKDAMKISAVIGGISASVVKKESAKQNKNSHQFPPSPPRKLKKQKTLTSLADQ